MPRYRIDFDIRHCEGNFNCVGAAPDYFFALPGGLKADLADHGKDPAGFITREIEAADLEQAIEAARVCPPQVIRVIDLDTGDVIEGPKKFPVEREGIETPS